MVVISPRMIATRLSIPSRDEVQAEVGPYGSDVAEEDADGMQTR